MFHFTDLTKDGSITVCDLKKNTKTNSINEQRVLKRLRQTQISTENQQKGECIQDNANDE